MNQAPFSVCVYCGSRHGVRADYTEAAKALGRDIGERGWQLVYGGGKVGLMGEVADAALAAGGRVVGVIPESLKQREVGHDGLHELLVVPTMHLRKQAMAERADIFVALPGGIGTLEELYEVWTWRQLGYHDQPIGLLNTAGYYDGLLRFMANSVSEGFLTQPMHDMLQVDNDPVSLLARLAANATRATGPDDYSRV
ncbi:MAG: TIGR00730 family Rossman fold protein [Pseudomonadota bacterium]|nr:TIGR00730 family Rossman fold protein [Pseudomonadota bacterium]